MPGVSRTLFLAPLSSKRARPSSTGARDPGGRNRVDYGPHCEEIWLDKGEWELVEGLAASGEFTKVFTQSWQYAVRAGLTTAMEEQRLRDLLANDYERVVQFAEWLQSQPAKHEIVARLKRRTR